MKAGWKTSEFWGSVVAAVVPLLNGAFGWNLPVESMVGVAVSVAAYALSRGMAKKTQ
jgi:hypothetical protein